MFHVSRVTCHVSRVICHVSQFTFFSFLFFLTIFCTYGQLLGIYLHFFGEIFFAHYCHYCRGPKSAYIRLYPSTDVLCPPVEAYVRLSHGHRPLPHPRETLVEVEAGDLIPSLPFAEAGFGEDARGTRIVLP